MPKKAIFTEEEDIDTSVLEDLTASKEELSEEEKIENLFSYEPIRVEEIPKHEDRIVVSPLRDYSFSFGGTWYHLKKGISQGVPEAVRDFLLKNKTNPKIKDIW